MNIGSREGLSSNIVNKIFKDRYGYMWFATDDGLNKFDGNQIVIYRHNPDDSTSIPSNNIHDLYEDQSGNLWIGTGAGLVFYNRKKDAFINYSGNNPFSVTSIISDKDGTIWVSGYTGLFIADLKTRKLNPFPAKKSLDRELISQPVLCIFKTKTQRIWLGTTHGLFLYNPDAKSFKGFYHSEGNPNSLADNSIKTIMEDGLGRLWVGTNNGLSMMQPDGAGFVTYRHIQTDATSLSSNIIYSIAAEPNGKMWIGTEEGLNILNPATGKAYRVKRNPRGRYNIVGKAVKSMLIDKQGIYWVGTFRGGINKYDKNLPFFNLEQSNSFDAAGLSASVVTSFASKSENEVFVGTDGGGLNLFDIGTGKFKHISLSPDGKGRSILTLEKNGGQLWIGTYLDGIFVYDTKTSSTKQIKAGPGGVSSNEIFCIRRDSRGNIWIGTNGQGVDCLDAETKQFQHYNKNGIARNRIQTNGYIRAIEEDKEGNIWIGSYGSGVVIYNPITGTSEILSRSTNQILNDNITSICVSANGLVWVGTAGDGLAYYDRARKRFISYSEKAGLANGAVYKILEDNSGVLWLSTNKGISSFDPRSKRFKNYSYYNGLQRSPFVQGAGLKTADGRIFFGGIDGFNYFIPEKLRVNSNVPKVVLTELRVNNKVVIPSEDSEITEHISIAKEIHLDYKQNLSINFAALNYTSPHENRYMYKLENFEKEWNNVGKVNSAVYTNLDPGKYIFHVKAISDSGDWQTPVTSITIYVNPPFWLTYYAYFFYLVSALTLLWFMRFRGIKKLEAKFAIEQERIKIQQTLHQERLEAERVHEFDQLRIKFLTNLSHEFRTPISLIVGPVEQLLQLETKPEKSYQLNMIRRNSRRLLNLVNQLLDFRNLDDKELRLNATQGDIISFSRDVAESFRDLSERKNINFQFISSIKYYFADFDHEKIERVLFNLLSNAFKFTLSGGEVILNIDRAERGDGLLISLQDTGIGMENDAKDRIFDRFYRAESDMSVLNQGSGIGLSIVREFIKMHDGSIEVESIKGEGSVFRICLPFKEKREAESLIDLPQEGVSGNELFNDSEKKEESPSIAVQLPVVLLVEDNEDFRFYLKDNLKTFYKIIEASDGKEGWQKVLSSHPQIVVSDISMPYLSGIDLCKKIKADKRTSHLPVLLLTALTGEEDQLLGLETGANDYMTKPFNSKILNIKIRNLLALNEKFKSTYSKQVKVVVPDVKIQSDDDSLLGKVIRYIETNQMNSQLSVEDMSRTVGMSRSSLYSKLLELTGQTPVEFIRSVKLDKAAMLLEKSDFNIAQVSYSVGFSTPNYFARAFKARFGMLPSEYAQLKRSENQK